MAGAWHKVAESAGGLEWQANGMCVAEVNGRWITLALVGDQVFAFAYKCPHASGVLADGWVDRDGCVVCPIHRYRFSIKNGRDPAGEGYYMKVYPVESRPDGIFVFIKTLL